MPHEYPAYPRQDGQPNGYYCYDASHQQGAYPNQQHHAQQVWHAVPRSWQNVNPEVRRVAQDPALDASPYALRPDARHAPNPAHQQHPTQPVQRREGAVEMSRPQLNPSNLDQFNQRYAPAPNMARWENAEQRSGPWDGVGYVRGSGQYRRGGDSS